MIIYPAIDLFKGQCVRLIKGDFNQVTVYSKDPVKIASDFADAGAEWLHLVDLEGSRLGTSQEQAIVKRILSDGRLKVQLGGGIRTLKQAQDWLNLGVERVVLGSAMVDTPHEMRAILERLGSEAVVLALDVKGTLEQGLKTLTVATQGWTVDHGLDVSRLLKDFQSWGGRYVLSTEVARDGTLGGPSDSLYQRLRLEFPEIRLISSGGIRTVTDLQGLGSLGVHGAIVGRALYEGSLSLKEALQC